MHVVKSVRGKRTLFFAGFKPNREPRFTPKARDATYLELSAACLVRDTISNSLSKVSVCHIPDVVNHSKIDEILASKPEYTMNDLIRALS